MRRMETLQDLIEEAKVRTVWWAICTFAICYFLSHTSKSMWTNIPMSILILSFLRYLSYHVDLRWRVRPVQKSAYLSSVAKRQLSTNDHRLSSVHSSTKWRRKVDSPLVADAMESLIDKLLRDFVVDLWYSSITPDKEVPEIIRGLLLDVLGEVSRRVKEMNLVDLLTRDMVDLIGNQLDLYRKNQADIGVNVMITLSSEERDEKLKSHLLASKELHPALLSPHSEHKVLQQIVGGVLAIVLKPQESQCPLVRSLSRELLTCLVLQPIMNFASPNYINEVIELVFLSNKQNSQNTTSKESDSDRSTSASVSVSTTPHTHPDLQLTKVKPRGTSDSRDTPRQADWAVVLDAATKRRKQVLEPENLDNMWTKGRHYQKKLAKKSTQPSEVGPTGKEFTANFKESIAGIDDKYMVNMMHASTIATNNTQDMTRSSIVVYEKKEGPTKGQIKRSTSSPDIDTVFNSKSGEGKVVHKGGPDDKGGHSGQGGSHSEGYLHVPKIRCRVVGAYFEKLGSKSFAVYSIAVTDADNKTWFVKRRYRNFERLHRQLKEIPNYSLHLPPKKFLSSSTDDYLVHQRCILLDKYLQDLLSMANIAEQHEVWDFLSASSKNYSFGKSSSVMKTLAVNMDDAMDDIVRQFKGVTDGLSRIVSTPSSEPMAFLPSSSNTTHLADHAMAMSWNGNETRNQDHFGTTARSLSDDENNYQENRMVAVTTEAYTSGWHSDNETKSDSKGFSSRMNQESESRGLMGVSRTLSLPDTLQDPIGMPPEWTPPNASVPLLNLVDKIFQLNRRGWLRRQVLWISKQILQLVMEDAIDDWILRQIHLLRRDNVVSRGILWVQDLLWPNGTFFTRVEGYQPKMQQTQSQGRFGSRQSAESASQLFESQLEASRRANDVKKLLLGGTPSTLVSLIGQNAYKRCARDVYYFLQSTVCVKQLAYSMLELVIISLFPELQQLISDIHEKAYDS
ncbi:Sorting nexin-16 [Carex littledalei]|uniref:Sorting nexin-16 n=1 Tax=Carex littledalei TaxID=544730 RepID=A0A833R741_9POAL|nr:Sorting nexin-16 [Carex littledalei]